MSMEFPTCLADAYSGQGIHMEPHRMTETAPGWIPERPRPRHVTAAESKLRVAVGREFDPPKRGAVQKWCRSDPSTIPPRGGL